MPHRSTALSAPQLQHRAGADVIVSSVKRSRCVSIPECIASACSSSVLPQPARAMPRDLLSARRYLALFVSLRRLSCCPCGLPARYFFARCSPCLIPAPVASGRSVQLSAQFRKQLVYECQIPGAFVSSAQDMLSLSSAGSLLRQGFLLVPLKALTHDSCN